jgi:hypothetical protein
MAEVVSGLKASGLDVGLPIDFGVLHLRDGVHRVLNPDILRRLRTPPPLAP